MSDTRGRAGGTAAVMGCALLSLMSYIGLKILVSCPALLAIVPPAARDAWLLTYSEVLILACMIGIVSSCLRLAGLGWADLGWSGRVTAGEAAWGCFSGLAVFVSLRCFSSTVGAPPRQTEPALAAFLDPQPWHWVHLLASVALLGGALEELVYRGALVGFLRRSFGGGPAAAAVAACVSGAVFSALHPLSLQGYALYWAIGVFLSLVYMHTGSLGAVVIAHVLANALPLLQGLRETVFK